METPSQTLESRVLQMTREAVKLSAATAAAQQAERLTLLNYAAGVVDMPEVRQAQAATREALEAEQAHAVALSALEAEVERREMELRHAEMRARIEAAADRLDVLETLSLRRIAAAEREVRAAWSAWSEAKLEVQQAHALGQSLADVLRALPEDGNSLNGDVLARWQRYGADFAPEVPAPMAVEAGEDHERRWRPVMSLLERAGR